MDWEKAASYWEEKAQSAKKMDGETLLREARRFLEAHNTCALATSCDEFVRCTPIEYTYWRDCLWLLSEGGKKFAALRENKNVAVAIFDAYQGFGKLGGMQITGRAELVEAWSEEYLALLTHKKIPQAALRGLDHAMYLIKIVPRRMELLNSAFREMGFDVRQELTL